MCSSGNGGTQVLLFSTKPRRIRVRVFRLSRRREEKMENNIELKNLKLYMENINIYKENEKLRKQACLLHQEKLALLSQLQRRSLQCDFRVGASPTKE